VGCCRVSADVDHRDHDPDAISWVIHPLPLILPSRGVLRRDL